MTQAAQTPETKPQTDEEIIDSIGAYGYGWHDSDAVSYTHLTLPTILRSCRSRWSPYH